MEDDAVAGGAAPVPLATVVGAAAGETMWWLDPLERPPGVEGTLVAPLTWASA